MDDIKLNQNVLELLCDNGFSKYSPGTVLYSVMIGEVVQRLAVCSSDSEKINLKRELLIPNSEFYSNVVKKLNFNLVIFHELIIVASEDIKLNQDNFVQEICKLNNFRKFDYRVFAYDLAEKILNEENDKVLSENNNSVLKLVKKNK